MKKKSTDFAICLNSFLADYLVNKIGVSPLTIDSYRYTFVFLLEYLEEIYHFPADKVTLKDLTREKILGFLQWLQESRGNSAATRNQRQAAINSFVRFLMYEKPDYLDEYQRILSIPSMKTPGKEISYLKEEGIDLLMDCVNTSTREGLRDYAIFSLMISSGIRVSEVISIRVKDISLHEPCTLLVHGKGNKSRFVPILKPVIPILNQYLAANHLTGPEKREEWLFTNHMKNQLTRQGVNYIIRKYGDMAREKDPELIPADLSAHKLRHSTAMTMVAAGVDLIYIRDLLGHSSVKTTELYARTDAKRKREAIEAASKEIVPPEDAQWDDDEDLKSWLKNFGKN